MFWGNIKACSNVLFCLGTRRVLDLKTINQMLFHTLSTSLAFPGEPVVASWFQVGKKQQFFGRQCDYFFLVYPKGTEQGGGKTLVCFVTQVPCQKER